MQKGQLARTSGPCWMYSSRDSRFTNLARRALSMGVRTLFGRREARRLNSTSVGIWRRDWVRRNTFSGEKRGRARIRKTRAAVARMVMARKVGRGSG